MGDYHKHKKIEEPKENIDKQIKKQPEIESRKEQKPKTMKESLMSHVSKDTYLEACERNKEREFLNEFSRIGYSLYLHDTNKKRIPDLKKDDIRKIVKEMKETLELRGKLPLFPRYLDDGVVENLMWVGPLIAELYSLKTGETAHLTIGDISSVEREVRVFDPNENSKIPKYTFGHLGCVYVYPQDLDISLGHGYRSSLVPIETACKLARRRFNPNIWKKVVLGAMATGLFVVGAVALTPVAVDYFQKQEEIRIIQEQNTIAKNNSISTIKESIYETLTEMGYLPQHFDVRSPAYLGPSLFDIMLSVNVDKDETTGGSITDLPKWAGFDITFFFNFPKKGEQLSGFDKLPGSEFEERLYYPDYYKQYPSTLPQAKIISEQYVGSDTVIKDLKEQYKQIIREGIQKIQNEIDSLKKPKGYYQNL